MKTIGHISKIFLKTTETFVYHQIVRNTAYRNLVFASKCENSRIFPIKNIIKFKGRSDLLDALRNCPVDLLHAHFAPNALTALRAKKELNIPMLTFVHGYDAKKFPTAKPDRLKEYKELFREGELFAVPSRAIKRELVAMGCPKKKVVVCHLGINLERFQFKPRRLKGDAIRLISVGRLVEKKGHSILIQALSLINKKMPNFHLTIIGSGKLEERLKEQIKELGLSKKITMLGGIPPSEVLRYLDRSHIFCLASVTAKDGDMEGLPVSILEAQAMGLPVVSTRHSGIPEGVNDGKSALLATEGDIRDFARKLYAMMSTPENWAEFGARGRRWVEKYFDAKKQAYELSKIYDRLESGGKR